ncbi:MAG: SDR family NAD(P)-dependent oxidoreductase [Myxococcota bacterium]
MSAPRVAVITGASAGVGRGIALACGAAGWRVWIAARRARESEAVAREVSEAGGSGRFVACDVADGDSVARAIAQVIASDGRLDAVAHNATSGLSPKPTSLRDVPLADVRDHVAVSLRGAYWLARAAHAPLCAARGAYLLLTSEAGFEGKARLPVYAAVKAAQRGFARALAREWGADGIRVNCLAPLAASPAMERAFALDPSMAARVLGRMPLAALGDPVADVGAAARFLLSDDARFVTGHTLMADGGSCPVT